MRTLHATTTMGTPTLVGGVFSSSSKWTRSSSLTAEATESAGDMYNCTWRETVDAQRSAVQERRRGNENRCRGPRKQCRNHLMDITHTRVESHNCTRHADTLEISMCYIFRAPFFFMLASCAAGSDRVALATIASTARSQRASERAHWCGRDRSTVMTTHVRSRLAAAPPPVSPSALPPSAFDERDAAADALLCCVVGGGGDPDAVAGDSPTVAAEDGRSRRGSKCSR